MGTPTKPDVGDKHIDASAVKTRDLTPEQVMRKVKLREGYAEAITCLGRLTAEQTSIAGINAAEVQRCVELKAELDHARSFLPAAEKLVSMLRDSKFHCGDQIAMILSETASQVRRRLDRDPRAVEVLGALEDLFDYVSGPAYKAAATRAKLAAKAAAAKSDSGGEEGEEGEGGEATQPASEDATP
jgi:hypothetical protein